MRTTTNGASCRSMCMTRTAATAWRYCCGPARRRPAGDPAPPPLIRRIRRHWPHTRILIRGDSHYGRSEVMDWCDANDVGFILGLSGNPVLAAQD